MGVGVEVEFVEGVLNENVKGALVGGAVVGKGCGAKEFEFPQEGFAGSEVTENPGFAETAGGAGVGVGAKENPGVAVVVEVEGKGFEGAPKENGDAADTTGAAVTTGAANKFEGVLVAGGGGGAAKRFVVAEVVAAGVLNRFAGAVVAGGGWGCAENKFDTVFGGAENKFGVLAVGVGAENEFGALTVGGGAENRFGAPPVVVGAENKFVEDGFGSSAGVGVEKLKAGFDAGAETAGTAGGGGREKKEGFEVAGAYISPTRTLATNHLFRKI